MSGWKVMLSEPDLGAEEIRAVSAVIRSKWLTMGELTFKFEESFCAYALARHAVFLNSGTAALHLALRALGIGKGDEVICPSLTFVATANSILYAGARPVFADVTGLDDFNISPDDIKKKVSRRTKAIMVVHYAGYPCRMDAIKKLAHKYGLYLIEDASHAAGARFKGIDCGVWGDIGAFSFFPNKNMTTGEGGMLVTNKASLANKARLLRSHAMTKGTWDRFKGRASSYEVTELGYNYRPGEMNAALGSVQLKKLDSYNRKRKRLTSRYRERLGSFGGCILPFLRNSGEPSYHIFPVLLPGSVNRGKLMERLKKRGIQTSIHYPPIHKFLYYRKNVTGNISLPLTESIGRRELTLPLYPGMAAEQVDYVADSLKKEMV